MIGVSVPTDNEDVSTCTWRVSRHPYDKPRAHCSHSIGDGHDTSDFKDVDLAYSSDDISLIENLPPSPVDSLLPAPPPPSPGDVRLVIPLPVGWTWFSLNAIGDDRSVGNLLSGIGDAEDFIKSQTEFAQYYAGFGWYGTLAALSPTSMYKIKVSQAQQLVVEAPAVSLSTPLLLVAGWNFLPCLLQQSTGLAAAMPAFTYATSDTAKSQTAFAQFCAPHALQHDLT